MTLRPEDWPRQKEAFECARGTVRPNNPVTTIAGPDFGRVTSADDSRIMQLAFKYTF